VAPLEEDLPLLASDPERVRGTHYDVILNGVELGSGSLRNHRADVQRRIFEVLGYEKQETEARFGFMLAALDAGAPPHGGFAFGYDRWTMLLAGAESLRDVVARGGRADRGAGDPDRAPPGGPAVRRGIGATSRDSVYRTPK
jgi:aspartyl-tRNA synthetase